MISSLYKNLFIQKRSLTNTRLNTLPYMETITVEIIHSKAYRLLEDLADLNVIRLHKTDEVSVQTHKPTFGFARRIIKHIDDDFNDTVSGFSDYMP